MPSCNARFSLFSVLFFASTCLRGLHIRRVALARVLLEAATLAETTPTPTRNIGIGTVTTETAMPTTGNVGVMTTVAVEGVGVHPRMNVRAFRWSTKHVVECFLSEGRKRRRSPSPYDRERYDPRPRYDDYGLLFYFLC